MERSACFEEDSKQYTYQSFSPKNPTEIPACKEHLEWMPSNYMAVSFSNLSDFYFSGLLEVLRTAVKYLHQETQARTGKAVVWGMIPSFGEMAILYRGSISKLCADILGDDVLGAESAFSASSSNGYRPFVLWAA